MAETALRKTGVDFSKVTGRDDNSADHAIVEAVAGPLDGSLELNVKDFHPHKADTVVNVVMQDPKRNPRFPKEAPLPVHDPDAPLAPLPNYDYNKSKEPVLVNMDKMQGRIDHDAGYEEEVMREEKIDQQGGLWSVC